MALPENDFYSCAVSRKQTDELAAQRRVMFVAFQMNGFFWRKKTRPLLLPVAQYARWRFCRPYWHDSPPHIIKADNVHSLALFTV